MAGVAVKHQRVNLIANLQRRSTYIEKQIEPPARQGEFFRLMVRSISN